MLNVYPYIFDLELSGRCNTVCSFCPRHEMKRGENFMTQENFDHFVTKIKDYSDSLAYQAVYLPYEKASARLGSRSESAIRVILCGMGESLMHPKCGEWVNRLRTEVGIRVSVVTNGLLLTDKKIEMLKNADITVILVSVPGIDRESYSRTMKIDWDRVIDNIERTHKALPGKILINATIPDNATFTAEQVIEFWKSKGIELGGLSTCHNRGGFLEDSDLTGKVAAPSHGFCGIYARHNFISWDGSILSCCHDLHAENILGHLSTHDFFQIAQAKNPQIVTGPNFRICQNCNDAERCHANQIITMKGSPKTTSMP